MTLICAWCKKWLGRKAPLDDLGVTHGICPACTKRESDKADKIMEAAARLAFANERRKNDARAN